MRRRPVRVHTVEALLHVETRAAGFDGEKERDECGLGADGLAQDPSMLGQHPPGTGGRVAPLPGNDLALRGRFTSEVSWLKKR